jgi:hypothetical protein
MSHTDIFSESILQRKLAGNFQIATRSSRGNGTFTNDASIRRALAAA